MRLLIVFFFVVFSAFENKAALSTDTLTIQISNIRNERGQLIIAIFDNSKDFLDKPYMFVRTSAVSPELEVNFENLKFGEYALSIIHDENNNDKLDTNLFGVPKEGFGFSNDAMGTFGPPSFEKSKINWFGGNEPVKISLKYFL
ncbi:MAG TPA: DUF2141 domain-containing protein [Cyclobacteriaceae bacterium]|nr:DUF2141 domain-containing protein [Cyclobacteriaceae bacterium]